MKPSAAVSTLTLCFSAAIAAAQGSGSIEVVDVLSPSGVKTVEPDWNAIETAPLGSRGNPIRAFEPRGQRFYLQRLVCADGSTPVFRRVGSGGRGPYETIVDIYDVGCGESHRNVFMDMYHPRYVECRPAAGFDIRGTCEGS